MKKALKVVGIGFVIVTIGMWTLLGISEWYRAVEEDGETKVGDRLVEKVKRNFEGKKDKTDKTEDGCGVIYELKCNYK